MRKVSIILPYYNRKEYLTASLDSFLHFYGKWKYNLEVIIVDDGSSPEHRLESLIASYADLPIKLIRIDNKRGRNPALPYNRGVRGATGEILLLSSPEIVHTTDIFKTADFDELTDKDYWCFSVFCPTDVEFNCQMIDRSQGTLAGDYFTHKRYLFEKTKHKMYEDLGANGRNSFNNFWGSWYLHSKYRPSNLNFCVALTKKRYEEIRGFDERMISSGYDDTEILERLLPSMRIQYFDDFVGLHLNHPPTYEDKNPIGNKDLYEKIKNGSVPRWNNDDWGKL